MTTPKTTALELIGSPWNYTPLELAEYFNVSPAIVLEVAEDEESERAQDAIAELSDAIYAAGYLDGHEDGKAGKESRIDPLAEPGGPNNPLWDYRR